MSKEYSTRDVMERFNERIDVLPNGCWQWTKSLASVGYGKFWIRQTQFLAHKFSYWLFKGDMPEGLHLDHLCRNRGCVNPDHLEPVTIGENVLRGTGLAPLNAGKTACPRGHEYTGKNSRGDRICSMCANERRKIRRQYVET